ncbi:TIGR00303 family protein [Trichothermofontia sichuanensis B231]|uniref:nicotinate mononucleotide-dependent phosphoribosyltransferase CobT n=1 Tax=Trichothermofontia sichuanensis TaxID=3045816 RepID=UPI002246510A|nr:TIGR00303 family protein [Trichothermofontia sichuanensis]UZQ54339.1 TIGR00303 family protein [Trichothermofontia sichuanensis B231]
MFVQVHTQIPQGQQWLQRYRGQLPLLACVLGFTATALIPGISAAGKTSNDRRYTAIADAEFLHNGPTATPRYPLPPLTQGASPVLISRAVLEALAMPLMIFNAGLPIAPSVPTIDLGGQPAQCVSTGQALPRAIVEHLFQQGCQWGQTLAEQVPNGYLVLAECVVGGTTTALAVLTALGVPAAHWVNSSHPVCNHAQKQAIVAQGLEQAGLGQPADPFQIVAAVGDPMQIGVAGMAIAASRQVGVLLAGGTQMLAVYALIQRLTACYHLDWQPEQVVVGTTRWVADDPTGGTIALAESLPPVSLLATPLSFAASRFATLRAYEAGYVKEGVGAGGCAIAASLARDWGQAELLASIEALAARTGS